MRKNNEKPPQNQRQMDATGFAAVFQCQDSIMQASIRAAADTFLTSYTYCLQACEAYSPFALNWFLRSTNFSVR